MLGTEPILEPVGRAWLLPASGLEQGLLGDAWSRMVGHRHRTKTAPTPWLECILLRVDNSQPWNGDPGSLGSLGSATDSLATKKDWYRPAFAKTVYTAHYKFGGL